jgi:LPXTG-site transpeptidase (sortase) family protein
MKFKTFAVVIFVITAFLFTRKFVTFSEKVTPAENPYESSSSEPSVSEINYREVEDVKEPQRLVIPSLNIGSSVEIVGKDSSGRMDVPKEDVNVAWWKYGPIPGEVGNAVIAGHFDTKTGEPAIFYDLGNLKVGDEIMTIHENGKSRTFEVYKVEKFKDNEFPLELVFGENEGKNLNLITCAGEFNSLNKNYSDRLVVFARLKEIRPQT